MVSNKKLGLETKLILKSGEIVDGLVFDKNSLEAFNKNPQQFPQYLGMPNDNFPIIEAEEEYHEGKSEYELRCERVEEERRMAELEESQYDSNDLLAYLLLFNDDYDY